MTRAALTAIAMLILTVASMQCMDVDPPSHPYHHRRTYDLIQAWNRNGQPNQMQASDRNGQPNEMEASWDRNAQDNRYKREIESVVYYPLESS